MYILFILLMFVYRLKVDRVFFWIRATSIENFTQVRSAVIALISDKHNILICWTESDEIKCIDRL